MDKNLIDETRLADYHDELMTDVISPLESRGLSHYGMMSLDAYYGGTGHLFFVKSPERLEDGALVYIKFWSGSGSSATSQYFYKIGDTPTVEGATQIADFLFGNTSGYIDFKGLTISEGLFVYSTRRTSYNGIITENTPVLTLISDAGQINNITYENGSITATKLNGELIDVELNTKVVDDALYMKSDSGYGNWLPATHPNMSTSPSLLPLKFGDCPIYEKITDISGTLIVKTNNFNANNIIRPNDGVILTCDDFNMMYATICTYSLTVDNMDKYATSTTTSYDNFISSISYLCVYNGDLYFYNSNTSVYYRLLLICHVNQLDSSISSYTSIENLINSGHLTGYTTGGMYTLAFIINGAIIPDNSRDALITFTNTYCATGGGSGLILKLIQLYEIPSSDYNVIISPKTSLYRVDNSLGTSVECTFMDIAELNISSPGTISEYPASVLNVQEVHADNGQCQNIQFAKGMVGRFFGPNTLLISQYCENSTNSSAGS